MAFRVRKGGVAAGGHRPNETELIALGTAWASVFVCCDGQYTVEHSTMISDEVKRAGASTQDWSNAEVHDRPNLVADRTRGAHT